MKVQILMNLVLLTRFFDGFYFISSLAAGRVVSAMY